MARIIYSLFVGIDAYQAPVPALHGCVNDITQIHDYLKERIQSEGDTFEPLMLTNEKATRQAIMDGFRKHLGRARSTDVALFYYSGHGSQENSPPEFWHLEPDRLDETLVCYDSRTEEGWDLADKELAQLISEVSRNKPHMVIILDCCHSGSGTRVLEDTYAGVRMAPTDLRYRPASTFIVSPEQATLLENTNTRSTATQTTAAFTLPQGRHIVLSACQPDETAKELVIGGQRRGIFSYYLLDTLRRNNAILTYRDIFKRAYTMVRAGVTLQTPVMEASEPSDIEQPFLGGAISPGKPYFTLSNNGTNWLIDGGIVHGITPGNGQEKTILAVFPLGTQLHGQLDMRTAIGQAVVEAVFPGNSQVAFTLFDGSEPPADRTYKALVTALPLPPMIVSMEGDNVALNLMQEAIAVSGPDGKASQLIRIGTKAEATLQVLAADGRLSIKRTGDTYPLTVDISYTPDNIRNMAQLAVSRQEHMARWFHLLQLTNPASGLSQDAVQLDILVVDDSGKFMEANDTTDVPLTYSYKEGKWRQPQFKIRLKNQSSLKLYCILIDLPESFGAYPLLPGGGIWLDAGQEAWAITSKGSDIFYASVPDKLYKQGLTELRDTLKLIVSTEEVDATLLAQEDLPVSLSQKRSAPELKKRNTLNRLMHRVGTRHFGGEPESDEPIADWITAEVSFTTIRPLESSEVNGSGKDIVLVLGVTISGHPELKAKVRVSSLAEATRSTAKSMLPPMLRNHSSVEPFELTGTSHRGAPGMSVLEISDISNAQSVTPEQPLILQTEARLSPDEHLLPLTFDGELYLPLGHATQTSTGTEIHIERLPFPADTGNRSLTGSVKIFFQKIISEKLGLEYTYPLLAEASIIDEKKVEYATNKKDIAAKVTGASRILLFIHGIIGDTLGMAACTRPHLLDPQVLVPALKDSYDLILTFDYENINTTIEDNARLLKMRLEDVGLGAGHEKTLHIAAHSMGGLVSRWFIEREGGNQVVNHLVMLGTPNGGSPWARIQDMATVALGIALNGLSTVVWPVKVLGTVVSAIETIDVSLDQMKPGSDFLKNLSTSPDPGVPYTVIAGQTSIIPAATAGVENSLLAKLWRKIKPRNWMYDVASLAFFHSPNDVAASVDSIYAVPANRNPAPGFLPPVPCDHMTYFNTSAGLEALLEVLVQKENLTHAASSN